LALHQGIVVAGMLAATMSVNSSYLLGWSAVISQDIVLPIREQMASHLSARADRSSSSSCYLSLACPDVLGPVLYAAGRGFTLLEYHGTIYLAGRSFV